ncbi:MAG: hypothetical protein AB1724_11255 [Thermodesulfobacteriota bacterium]
MSSGSDHCRELAARILNLMAAGFEADASVVHFINSTFAYPGYGQLQAILNNADSADREGLIELIISPDPVVCREMEELFSRASFSDEAVNKVLSLLPEALSTSVRVPGLSGAVCFFVPGSCRRRFLGQLNLTRAIDPEIRAALEERLPERSDLLAALAAIRHSRADLTGPRTSFLLRFIRQSGPATKEQWFSYLEVILDLPGRPITDEDMWMVFGAERERCLKQMEYSRRVTEQLNKSNMETLLLQGTRIGATADIEKISQQIKTIDEICLIVWGRIPMAGGAGFPSSDAVSFLFEKETPGE